MTTEKKTEICEKAHQICTNFLGSAWADEDNFEVETLEGGLTNKLYLCHLKENGKVKKTVVYRVYGIIMDNIDAQITESVVFSILGQKGVGPHLFGVFPGGRLEEYIEGRNLVTKDLADEKASVTIAKNVAKFHKLSMPTAKDPVIKQQLIGYYEKCKSLGVSLRKYEKDIDYVINIIDQSKSPIIFCHNDVHEGNCLIDEKRIVKGEDEMDSLRLIDFEYSNYGYRGFEFGNHFCEWMFDYSNPSWPHYHYKPEDWSTYAQKSKFVDAYCREMGLKPEVNRNRIIDEANDFALVSHIYWMLWSFIQARVSDIVFDYNGYAEDRYDAYLRLREELKLATETNEINNNKINV